MTVLFKGFPETDECQADAMLKACNVYHDVNKDSIEIAKPSSDSMFTVIKHTHPFDKYQIVTYIVAFNEHVYNGTAKYQLTLVDCCEVQYLV